MTNKKKDNKMVRLRNQDIFRNGNGVVQYLSGVDVDFVVNQLREYEKKGKYIHITVIATPLEELHKKMINSEKLPDNPLGPLVGY